MFLPPLGQLEGAAPAKPGVVPLAQPGKMSSPKLAMPSEKPCLAGPTDVGEGGDEAEFVGSAGLDAEVVGATMSGFLPKALDCFAGAPSGTVSVEVNVACSGRVAKVNVVDDGGLDAAVTGCVTDRLRYAAFPAHDMPDGFSFEFPVRYRAP